MDQYDGIFPLITLLATEKQSIMENLNSQFIKALQASSGLTCNSYLTHLKGSVEKVSDASNIDQVLYEYNQRLSAMVSENYSTFGDAA